VSNDTKLLSFRNVAVLAKPIVHIYTI